jgi:hypothetical protein
LALLLAAFCMAPTPGDIGGCGQDADELDAPIFFSSKRETDCRRCRECHIATDNCEEACAAGPLPQALPEHCYPLVHDGEVCLRALADASCDEYARYMSDTSPTAPTECNFCPPEEQP